MAWAGALSGAFFVLAVLAVVASVWLFRVDSGRDGCGAAPLVAMVGLGIGATLLALLGLVFLGVASSDSFGR